MMRVRVASIAIVLGFLCFASVLRAGPDHIETGDAGSTGGSAQPAVKAGALILQKIVGRLATVRGPADGQDMYIINIVDPLMFFASTDPVDDASADFDSQLFLFKPFGANTNAFGVLGSENNGSPSGAARIAPPSTDALAQVIDGPGAYLLAISRAGHQPVSSGGPIFQFGIPAEISGPDGPGGLQPHTGWIEPPASGGDYIISLRGAEAFPSTPAMSSASYVFMAALIVLSGVAVLVRRDGRVRQVG